MSKFDSKLVPIVLLPRDEKVLSESERKSFYTVMSRLEEFYPEHKTYAMDALCSGTRETAKKLATALGYDSLNAFLQTYGFEPISGSAVYELRKNCGYNQPGHEPACIKERLENVKKSLAEYYPDGMINRAIQSEHKKLSGNISGFYQFLGYESPEQFLNAYGYTCNYSMKGGTPKKNDFNATIEELKKRYPNGTDNSVQGLAKENPDLPLDSLRKNPQKECGELSLGEYLVKLGILNSASTRRSDEEKKEDVFNILETLKSRYEGKQKLESIKQYAEENPDLDIQRNVFYPIANKTMRMLFVEAGLLEKRGLTEERFDAIISELKARYEQKTLARSYKEMAASNKDLLPSQSVMFNACFRYKKVPLTEYIRSVGLLRSTVDKIAKTVQELRDLRKGFPRPYFTLTSIELGLNELKKTIPDTPSKDTFRDWVRTEYARGLSAYLQEVGLMETESGYLSRLKKEKFPSCSDSLSFQERYIQYTENFQSRKDTFENEYPNDNAARFFANRWTGTEEPHFLTFWETDADVLTAAYVFLNNKEKYDSFKKVNEVCRACYTIFCMVPEMATTALLVALENSNRSKTKLIKACLAVNRFHKLVSEEAIDALFLFACKSDCEEAQEILRPYSAAALGGNRGRAFNCNHPEEQICAQSHSEYVLDIIIAYSPELLDVVALFQNRLKYNDGGTVSALVLKTVLASYILKEEIYLDKVVDDDEDQVYYGKILIDDVDAIASAFDKESFDILLKTLFERVQKKDETNILRIVCRFGDETLCREVVQFIKKKDDWEMTDALTLSDTYAAKEYFYKENRLEVYAAARGKNVRQIIDVEMMPDFGLNEENKKILSVGDDTLVVSISPEFKPLLFSTKKKKFLKVFPSGYNDLKEEYAKFKQELKEFYAVRVSDMWSLYYSGDEIPLEIWSNIHCKNPLLTPLTKRVIWQEKIEESVDPFNKAMSMSALSKSADSAQTVTFVQFFVLDDQVVDVNGAPYSPSGPVSVAHILDMEDVAVQAWKKFVKDHSLTLFVDPFEHPTVVVKSTESLYERYRDYIIAMDDRDELKRELESVGLKVRSDVDRSYDYYSGRYTFDSYGYLRIGPRTYMRFHYVYDENRNPTGIQCEHLCLHGSERESDEILYYLDKATIKSAVAEDMDYRLTDDILDAFGVAQITEFIDISSQNDSFGCTARLLDYKNKKYPDDFGVDEFTLD